MLRRFCKNLLPLILALLTAATAFSACAEAPTPPPEEAPAEVGEFALDAPEPVETPVPEISAEQTPMPTLEPGSLNYPEGKVNFEREIWAILTRRWGLADFQAAGLMSSLYAESSFCPYNAENREGVDNRGSYEFKVRDSVGFGLAQWTTARRKRGLYRYAVSHGDANLVWDFDIQMAYMKSEINLTALKATETLYEATEWAVLHYERPSQAYENSWPGTRYGIARQIFEGHTGRAYEEPRPRFEIVGSDGADLLDGFAFDGEATVTVRSNYYWRLSWDGTWLDIACPNVYDPETVERCECGYAGETTLTLRALVPPLLRHGSLRFILYCGEGVRATASLTYAGPTLPELLREHGPSLAAILRAALSQANKPAL